MTDIMKMPIGSLGSLRFRDVFGGQSVDAMADLLQGKPAPSDSPAGSIEEIATAALANGGARGILKEFERVVIAAALDRTKGNVSAAARLIGVERKAFERRMARHRVLGRGR
jgi:DNA-binding NtrC family response regulator